ncbi:MAG: ABC transporter ATP-binding protein [Planctomycetes bacterium]|nr:ABC transporter ATP-binding protein [Planctomycetota bacterium]
MSQEHNQDEDFQNSRIQLTTWKRLFAFARAYPGTLTRLVVFATTTGAFETCFPLVSKNLIDAIEAHQLDPAGAAPNFVPYVATYVGLMVGMAFSVWGFIRAAGSLKACCAADVRTECFEKLQNLEFAYYDKRATGWLMSRLTSDCERLANIMAWGMLDITWSITFLLGTSAIMVFLNWKLGLMVMLVAPLLAFASRFFQSRLLTASRRIRKINSTITADFNESIMGVATTKVFTRQQANQAEFDGKATEMFEASVRNAVLSSMYLPIILTLGSLAAAIALIQGGFQVTGGWISLGTLVAFLAYTRMVFDPLQQLAHIFSELQMAQASGERIVELLETEPAIFDSEEVLERKRAQAGAPEPHLADDGYPTGVGNIRFEHVSFHYGAPAGQEPKMVLQDIDLEVHKGETIALVGATGGGKTTFISLLCRFYEPTSGRILVDGVPLKDRSLSWLQSEFGIVLQDPHLFSGTVLENIRYGRLEATDEEVLHAAHLVGADPFIEKLDGGYGFEVGEGGSRLSAGERQLVSFARALLKDPSVLVMDEATSHIDTETEHHLQKALARVLENRTCVVIAHRLSTIENADRILVVHAGRIVEQGTHADLLAQKGRYAKLHAHQSLEAAADGW